MAAARRYGLQSAAVRWSAAAARHPAAGRLGRRSPRERNAAAGLLPKLVLVFVVCEKSSCFLASFSTCPHASIYKSTILSYEENKSQFILIRVLFAVFFPPGRIDPGLTSSDVVGYN